MAVSSDFSGLMVGLLSPRWWGAGVQFVGKEAALTSASSALGSTGRRLVVAV